MDLKSRYNSILLETEFTTDMSMFDLLEVLDIQGDYIKVTPEHRAQYTEAVKNNHNEYLRYIAWFSAAKLRLQLERLQEKFNRSVVYKANAFQNDYHLGQVEVAKTVEEADEMFDEAWNKYDEAVSKLKEEYNTVMKSIATEWVAY